VTTNDDWRALFDGDPAMLALFGASLFGLIAFAIFFAIEDRETAQRRERERRHP